MKKILGGKRNVITTNDSHCHFLNWANALSTESIQFNLKERFAAPLPEFYKRRIIFWQDEDREFESTLDELDLPGVNIVKLTGMNNFAVKKLLLHDDLTGNYLIYNPFS